MSLIVPAILTNNAEEFQRSFQVYPTFAKRVQLDVSDNTFAPSTTIPLAAIQQLPEGLACDIHLIAAYPSTYLEQILRLRPSLCIIHAEASENLAPIISHLKSAGIKVGLAFLPTTYPGKVKPYLEQVDHALIFAGNIGHQGGVADMLQTEKVKIIRQIKPDVEIGWDGGVNLTNIRALVHANIDVINVGGFISSSPNPEEAYKQLVKESEQRGVLI